MTLSVATTLQQWALFTGVVLAVGCLAWMLVVSPAASRLGEADGRALQGVERRVASLGAATTAVLIVVWVLRGVVQLVTFRDPFVPLGEDVSFLLFDLFWGTIWMGQGAVLALLLMAFLGARPPLGAPGHGDVRARVAASRWVGGVLGLALVATLSMSSHAMGVESFRALAVAADGVHLLAAATWIGSLAVILSVGRAGGNLFAQQLRAFSPLAVASVAALVLMGVALAWTHLQAVSDLWTESYGRVLSAKVLAAGAVFLLGFWNWRKGLPSIDRADGAREIQRRATLEVAVATGVLLLTAVLVHSPKP